MPTICGAMRGGRHLFEIAYATEITEASHHVFALAHLDRAPAHVVVAHANRVNDPGEGYVVRQQLVGIDRDLVLLHEPTDRRHLCHAWDRLELVAEKPILKRAQLGQVVPAGAIDQDELSLARRDGLVGLECHDPSSPALKTRGHVDAMTLFEGHDRAFGVG